MDLKNLVREYHDGLLLFEVSNRTIWGKAASDEAGLLQYFKKHKKQYKWDEPRFKGMAYHVKDEADVAAVRNAVKGLPFGDWADKLRSTFNNDSVIRIDATFGKMIKAPEEMNDVRGQVTADYQNLLEEQWVKELRKKYPVVINREVLATVNKH